MERRCEGAGTRTALGQREARFDFGYENDATGSHLVVKVNAQEPLIGYQVEMIANNHIRYLLPMDMRRKDLSLSFYFNITSKLALSKFLERREIRRNEFIHILDSLTRALMDCRNYLLDERCFILKADFIYINPATFEVFMAYVPLCTDTDIVSDYREFILSLIVSPVNFEEYSEDNYLQRILGFVKSDTFSIPGLNKLINELANSFGYPGESEEIPKLNNAQPPGFLDETSNDLPAVAEYGEEEVKDQAHKVSYLEAGHVVIAVISQIVIVALIIWGKGYLEKLGGDITVTYVAVSFIVAAIDVLLFKLLFVRKTPDTEKTVDGTGGLSVSDAADELKEEMSKIDWTAREAAGTSDDRRCDTVFLSETDQTHPCLLGESGGAIGRITIYKPDFVIGRLEGHVDHVCKNRAVGKVHARIISREGSYFLVDMNSKNGTFINEIRIDSNKEYEIKNMDRISFANSCYTFIMPQSGQAGGTA